MTSTTITEATVHPVETRTPSLLHVLQHPTIQLQLHNDVLQHHTTPLQHHITDLLLHNDALQHHFMDLQHHTTDLQYHFMDLLLRSVLQPRTMDLQHPVLLHLLQHTDP